MPWRALRRLCKSRPLRARHGISHQVHAALMLLQHLIEEGLPRSRSSRRQPTHFSATAVMVARLAGVSKNAQAFLTYYLWRQQRGCFLSTRSPDLPSNGSSLRDLDCTHSNYQTRCAQYCYLLSLPPRIRIG